MPDLLTTPEAAQYLRVPVEAFLRWARENQVPRIGERYCRWRKVDLDHAIEKVLVRGEQRNRKGRGRVIKFPRRGKGAGDTDARLDRALRDALRRGTP